MCRSRHGTQFCNLNLTFISYSFWNKGRKVLKFWKFEEKRGILYILNGNFVAFTIYFTNLKLILERSKKYEVEPKSKEGQTMQWLKRKEQTRLYKILHRILKTEQH